MKCSELKKILANIDDDVDVAVHIFNGECDADEFLSLVNDAINDRIVLSFTDGKYLI